MLITLSSKKPKYIKTSFKRSTKYETIQASHNHCIKDIIFYPKTSTSQTSVYVEILHIFIDRLDIFWHKLIDFFRQYYPDRPSYIPYKFILVTKYKEPNQLVNYSIKRSIKHLYTYKYVK